jgi:hypothetical protein
MVFCQFPFPFPFVSQALIKPEFTERLPKQPGQPNAKPTSTQSMFATQRHANNTHLQILSGWPEVHALLQLPNST